MASVLADRVVGLYVLFVLASIGVLLLHPWAASDMAVRAVCLATITGMAVATAGLATLLCRAVPVAPIVRIVSRLPWVGGSLRSVFNSMRLYREKVGYLLCTVGLSVAVHLFFVVCVFLTAQALYGNEQPMTLSADFALVTVSGTATVVPLPVGPFEAVFERLHRHVTLQQASTLSAGSGLLIALGYRLMGVAVAVIAVLAAFVAGSQWVLSGGEESNRRAYEIRQEFAPACSQPVRDAADVIDNLTSSPEGSGEPGAATTGGGRRSLAVQSR